MWREQGRFPELHLNIQGKLTGDTTRLTLKGERTDGWIFTEGYGELTLRKPETDPDPARDRLRQDP